MNKFAYHLYTFFAVAAFAIVATPVAWANDVAQTISVSPTLIEMQAVPQQSWVSELRVTNVNEYDIVVYPQIVNFEADGEDGYGTFIPVNASEASGQTLAEWVTVPTEPIQILRQQTVSIPLQVHIPEQAAPGGHYAAILVGTKPPQKTEAGESQVRTTQFVSSLMFVSVAGDVHEEGSIREFRTTESLLKSPDVTMEMRFENKGNVHVQPQGDIKIFNMWGQERGVIPINQQTHFGNVLPTSIRKFSFTWKGETAFYDIGRYSAVVTLGYGQNSKQFATSTTYFWIIPYTVLGSILLTLFVVYKIISFMVRRYVTRMIELSGVVPVPQATQHEYRYTRKKFDSTVVIGQYKHMSAPVRHGIREFHLSWRTPATILAKLRGVATFCYRYRLFFVACVALILVVWGGVKIWHGLMADTATYEVKINNAETTISLSEEEVAYNALRKDTQLPAATIQQPTLSIVNVSGNVGVAAKMRFALEQSGYVVTTLSSDPSRFDHATVIVYPVNHQNAALSLRKLLPGALLSALDPKETSDVITVYVGSDTIEIQ